MKHIPDGPDRKMVRTPEQEVLTPFIRDFFQNDYLSSHSFRSISALVISIPMVNRVSRSSGEAKDGMSVDICFIFWVASAVIRSSSRAVGMPDLVSSYGLSSW
jgi:hypothetical protein